MPRSILIIHNTFGSKDDPLYMSRSGVMDQVHAVAAALDNMQMPYDILPVEDIKHLTKLIGSRRENIIFNLAEEFSGSIEQACYVPAVCTAFGKSCTGNDTPGLTLCQNKAQAKSLLSGAHLRCPAGTVIGFGQAVLLDNLEDGSYFVKPAFCDASEGISSNSVVKLPDEHDRALSLIRHLQMEFGQPVIVEQFIPSRELNVSVMQRGREPKVLAIAEIDFSAFTGDMPRIVDYDAKWMVDSFGYKNTPRKIPADLDAPRRQEVEKMAIDAWRAMGCRDYARVDFRLDDDGTPYILEVNPNPDISADSGFAAALDCAGVTYERFVWTVINNAVCRFEKQQAGKNTQAVK